MKIREHPKIEWQRWLQPLVKTGSGFRDPPADIGDCVLNGVQYYRKDRDKADHLSLALEHQDKKQKFSVVHPFDDGNFAARLCKKLNDDCIGKSVRKIGDVEVDF